MFRFPKDKKKQISFQLELMVRNLNRVSWQKERKGSFVTNNTNPSVYSGKGSLLSTLAVCNML